MMSSIQRAAIAWNILDQQGVPGIANVHVHPVTNGTNICVAINKRYQGHAKQVAAALWGSGAASWRYKHVIVTDDDIDISNYEALDWAIAYRVNAGKDDIVIFPGSFWSPSDPSSPARGCMTRNPSWAAASRPPSTPPPRTMPSWTGAGRSTGGSRS